MKNKKSLFAEINALSVGILITLALLFVGSVALYIYMIQVPDKHVYIKDDAEIFADHHVQTIERAATDLMEEKDVNVVVVTTRDKGFGYTNSDEDCELYAGDMYEELAIHSRLQDNSGFCILIDLTLDEPGQRFFWLYTYGTAHAAVSDNAAHNIFNRVIPDLQSEDYSTAALSVIDQVKTFEYNDSIIGVLYAINIILPLLFAGIITLIVRSHRRSKITVSHQTYLDQDKCEDLGSTDNFIRKTVRVVRHSSSSGGGGGFSGGGGGRSGGGGGRF